MPHFFRKVLLLGVFLIPASLLAQKPNYTSSNKAAVKHYEKGLQAYDSKSYETAIKELQQAVENDSGFIEAYILLASVYEDNQDPEKAINQYLKSFYIKPDFFPNNYSRCATIELKLGRYNDAILHFEKYLSYPNNLQEKKVRVEKNIANCRFAIDAMKHPVPFDPKNLGDGVNSADPEYYFTFTLDQKTILFTRHIKDKENVFGDQEDFFISKFEDNHWTKAFQLTEPLNSKNNEGAPSLSIDGRILFFASQNRENQDGNMDIYVSQLTSENQWSLPLNLGPPVNTPQKETQPSFSSDGKTLYFVKRVRTKTGRFHTDIYSSIFQQDRTWSDPIPLNDKINTDGNEESVFIHPDNQTLYFSSDGHTGMGGFDIYMSRRQANGDWGESVNLGYPINTFKDENSFVVSADGLHAYFASDRAGGYGKLDIYVFDLYEQARPLLTNYIKGKVYDAVSNLPLSANYEIVDIETGNVIFNNSTDKTKGEFMVSLPAGKSYMLNVNKESYLFYSENFECNKPVEKQEAFLLNIPLKKPAVGGKVVLKNIFFDINKYDLKAESYVELNKLILFLGNNAKIKIEIGGHTDNNGDDKSNLILSESRAKSVYNYLIQKGISPQRLTFKGYGESVPIDSNETEDGRAQNRRTEFKIIAL